MSGPGQYLPDVTEGITRPEDLPQAKIIRRSRNFPHRPCPFCGKSCFRSRTGRRVLHDVGSLLNDRPRDLRVAYSRHCRAFCQLYFSADLSDLAPAGSHYTHRVISLAVRLVVEDGLPYRTASWQLNGRLALDLQRDQHAAGRQATSSCLHKARRRG